MLGNVRRWSELLSLLICCRIHPRRGISSCTWSWLLIRSSVWAEELCLFCLRETCLWRLSLASTSVSAWWSYHFSSRLSIDDACVVLVRFVQRVGTLFEVVACLAHHDKALLSLMVLLACLFDSLLWSIALVEEKITDVEGIQVKSFRSFTWFLKLVWSSYRCSRSVNSRTLVSNRAIVSSMTARYNNLGSRLYWSKWAALLNDWLILRCVPTAIAYMADYRDVMWLLSALSLSSAKLWNSALAWLPSAWSSGPSWIVKECWMGYISMSCSWRIIARA